MLRSCTQDVLEQVTPRSSSRGEALPRPPRDMANAQPVLRGYYTTWVDEIWNTTFKERRWGRGRRKPNKRDILLSAKNQEGKRKKKTHNHLSISHGGLVALAPGPGCPRGDHGSAVPLWAQDLGSGWLCPGSQHCPEQQQACSAWGRDIHAASINVS